MDGITHLLSASPDGWTQVAVLGKFKDPRYGEFQITREMVASWQKNLSAVTGQPEIALDYDHAADGPSRETRASGWLRAFRIEGTKVLAKIDWTPGARDAIKQGEYRYFSPTFVSRYLDDKGVNVGPTCLGGSLTNRPFLRDGMAPVTLDAYSVDDLAQDPEDAKDGGKDEATECSNCHGPVDTRGKCLDCGAKVKMLVADTPGMSDFLTKLSQALGVAADEDAVLAAITDGTAARTLAQGANLVVLPSEQVTTLTQQAEAGQKAADELHAMRFDTAYDQALSEGRITPALKDTYVALYAADAPNAIKLMAEAPTVVPIGARGDGTGATGDGDVTKLIGAAAGEFQVDAADTEIMQRAMTLAQAENIGLADALTKMALEA